MDERRNLAQQQPVPGGQRHDDPRSCDPPFRTHECGDWMGTGDDYIRDAINQGVWSSKLGRIVQLKAEFVPGRSLTSRTEPRIYYEDFVDFLKAIGWSRLPGRR